LNYGQGSSREHAALASMYLGVKAAITISFARIHRANLINFGILPLTFANAADYELLTQGVALSIADVPSRLRAGLPLEIVLEGDLARTAVVEHELKDRQIEIILAERLLNYMKQATS